jgi:hypothetical protein
MSELPSPSPKEPAEVTKFRRDYEEALTHARVSVEHTATDGWQNLYGSHQDAIQRARKGIADSLNSILEPLRLRHLTEDEEKALGDIKKEAIELRERDESFRRQTIEPVISPMDECAAVIEAARSSARAAEREFGLGNRGLIEVMETVIDTMPRVKFMTASGKLVIS